MADVGSQANLAAAAPADTKAAENQEQKKQFNYPLVRVSHTRLNGLLRPLFENSDQGHSTPTIRDNS